MIQGKDWKISGKIFNQKGSKTPFRLNGILSLQVMQIFSWSRHITYGSCRICKWMLHLFYHFIIILCLEHIFCPCWGRPIFQNLGRGNSLWGIGDLKYSGGPGILCATEQVVHRSYCGTGFSLILFSFIIHTSFDTSLSY